MTRRARSHTRKVAIVLFCTFVCMLSADSRAGQSEPIVTLSLSSAEISLGEPFFAFVQVSVDSGVEVSLPQPLELGEDIEELRREQTVFKRGDRDLYTYELTLMCFRLGELQIPEIPIVYATASGAQEARTAASRITVRGQVTDGKSELGELLPESVVRRDMSRVYVAVGVVVGLFVVSVLLALIGRLARRLRRPAPVRVRTPLEVARTRLDALEASTTLTSERRRAYVEMSEIVREYLGTALGISALDATTSEIENDLEDVELAATHREQMAEWLRNADLVKFAGFRPSEDDTRASLYAARGWIERVEKERQTQPEEEAHEEG